MTTILDSVRQVLTESGIGEVDIHESPEGIDAWQVIIYIGISGDLRGGLILKTQIPDARRLVERMLASMGFNSPLEDGFGELFRTTMGELANQISGRTITLLSARSIDCDISPPTVIVGDRINPLTPEWERTICRQVRGEFGLFTLTFGAQSNQSSRPESELKN